MAKTVQPLKEVLCVLPTGRRGADISPHVMWCDTEFAAHLACGHVTLVVRMATNSATQPNRPLPVRIRCQDCPAVPPKTRKGRSRKKPTPTTDPVVGTLTTALSQAYEGVSDDRRWWTIEWTANYSGQLTDDSLRHRGYAAMALAAVDEYLPNCHRNERAHEVRDALQAWHDDPNDTTRAAVATARKRLYNVQLRDGDWFSIRGVHAAAKLASPYPHNADGAREAATFGPQKELKIAEMRDARDNSDKHIAWAMLHTLTGQSVDNDDPEQAHQAQEAGLKHLSAAAQEDARLTELGSALSPIDPFLVEAMLTAYQHTVFGETNATQPTSAG